MLFKKCSKCLQQKTLDNFHNFCFSKDGKKPWCSACVSRYDFDYRSKNRDKLRAKGKIYYKNNKDKIREYNMSYQIISRSGDVNRQAIRILSAAKGRHRLNHDTCMDLDKQFIIDKINEGLCSLCGDPFVFTSEPRGALHPSIDRIDNNIGYLKTNIQLVHWVCNNSRGKLSISDYISLCQKTVDHAKSKPIT